MAGVVVRVRSHAVGFGVSKRFAVLFMGNGINDNHWGATGLATT